MKIDVLRRRAIAHSNGTGEGIVAKWFKMCERALLTRKSGETYFGEKL